jgi:hypothetical protein
MVPHNRFTCSEYNGSRGHHAAAIHHSKDHPT